VGPADRQQLLGGIHRTASTDIGRSPGDGVKGEASG
jgi:hypothetical protein